MIHFIPLEGILYQKQVEISNFLFDYDIKKLDINAKRIITHYILTEISEKMNDSTYFTYSIVPKSLELCECLSWEKLNKFINSLFIKINKMINYKIIFINEHLMYPHTIDTLEELSFWYGSFYDEFIVQTQKNNNKNTTQFKKFLHKNNLIELKEKFDYKKII